MARRKIKLTHDEWHGKKEQDAQYQRQCKACAAWIAHLQKQIEAEDARR